MLNPRDVYPLPDNTPGHQIEYKGRRIWFQNTRDGYINAHIYGPGLKLEASIVRNFTREYAEFLAKKHIDERDSSTLIFSS